MSITENTVNAELHTDNLRAIANAVDSIELREIVRSILEDDATVERLTRAVMVALIGSSWLDESVVSINYGGIRGEIKDALIDKIMRPNLQHLAEIESAARNWSRKPKQTPQPEFTPRQLRFNELMRGLLLAFDTSEQEGIDPLEALEAYVLQQKAERE